MKNRATFVIIILIYPLCIKSLYSQIEPNLERHEKISSCEKGTLAAEQDFINDDLGFYFYGLPNPRFNTWMRLMREAFDLKVKGVGCIIEEEGDCYNSVMRDKLREQYGNDVFERIEKKVDSLYKTGLGDRDATFKGGNAALLNYIYCSLDDNLLSTNANEIPIIVIRLSVTTTGKVENQGILFKNKFAKKDARYESEVTKLITNMPDWQPAIENKKKVKAGYQLPIKFEQEMKIRNCDSIRN